jgi:hypothetical protein
MINAFEYFQIELIILLESNSTESACVLSYKQDV